MLSPETTIHGDAPLRFYSSVVVAGLGGALLLGSRAVRSACLAHNPEVAGLNPASHTANRAGVVTPLARAGQLPHLASGSPAIGDSPERRALFRPAAWATMQPTHEARPVEPQQVFRDRTQQKRAAGFGNLASSNESPVHEDIPNEALCGRGDRKTVGRLNSQVSSGFEARAGRSQFTMVASPRDYLPLAARTFLNRR